MGDSNKTINKDAVLAGFYYGVKNPDNMSVMHAQTYSQTKMDEIKKEYKEVKFAEFMTAGEEYLAANKNKDGVITTPSGLQYKIINQGNGDMPNQSSKVKVSYRGTLVDGTEFDGSASASFFVNQVISGWTEGLQMMPVGSKWELYIPQNLGYGAMERPNIPPFSALIFELELLEIEQ